MRNNTNRNIKNKWNGPDDATYKCWACGFTPNSWGLPASQAVKGHAKVHRRWKRLRRRVLLAVLTPMLAGIAAAGILNFIHSPVDKVVILPFEPWCVFALWIFAPLLLKAIVDIDIVILTKFEEALPFAVRQFDSPCASPLLLSKPLFTRKVDFIEPLSFLA